MKTHLDCIPCFFKQALEASKLAGAGKHQQKKILDKVCRAVLKFSLNLAPPHMGRKIYKIVINETKNKDPFYAVKQKSNNLALKLYPKLKRKIVHSRDRIFTAVELAIAGNIIDFGVKNSYKVEEELQEFLKGNFNVHSKHSREVFSYQDFKRDLKKAKLILYLGDNAGEVVFDKLLIEEIKRAWPNKEVVYAVKKSPIINDALEEDAYFCGLDKYAEIISSGSDAPGTFLSLCSANFKKLCKKADMIISKGQGNFESLSGENVSIYFLFKAKCPMVAKEVGCCLSDVVLKHQLKDG